MHRKVFKVKESILKDPQEFYDTTIKISNIRILSSITISNNLKTTPNHVFQFNILNIRPNYVRDSSGSLGPQNKNPETLKDPKSMLWMTNMKV